MKPLMLKALYLCQERLKNYLKILNDKINDTKRNKLQDIENIIEVHTRNIKNNVGMEFVLEFLFSMIELFKLMRREIIEREIEKMSTTKIEEDFPTNGPKEQYVKQARKKKQVTTQAKRSTYHEVGEVKQIPNQMMKVAKSTKFQTKMADKSKANASIQTKRDDKEEKVESKIKNKNEKYVPNQMKNLKDIIIRDKKDVTNETINVNQKRSFSLFDKRKPKFKMKINGFKPFLTNQSTSMTDQQNYKLKTQRSKINA